MKKGKLEGKGEEGLGGEKKKEKGGTDQIAEAG